MTEGQRIAVVIPCYRVCGQILTVLQGIPPEVDAIICVDDACPDHSGDFIRQNCHDPRITVLANSRNQGVGGAMITGYRHCLEQGGFGIIVKMDGDDQMDPGDLLHLAGMVARGEAEYCKGSRFIQGDARKKMPLVRYLGNRVLALLSRFSSGYWDVTDPTCGYTAISAAMLGTINLDEISRGYFFESDILCQLGLRGVRMAELPTSTRYAGETSHVSIIAAAITFPMLHTLRFIRRMAALIRKRPFSQGILQTSALLSGLTAMLLLLSARFALSAAIFIAAAALMTGALLLDWSDYRKNAENRAPLRKGITGRDH